MTTNFGRDSSCTTAIRSGVLVSGPRLVAEAVYRRLTTPRGTLRGSDDEANYGLDLLNLIGSATTKADAAALPGRVQAELLKDERIDDVTVTVTSTVNGPSTSWSISIAGITAVGPFSLVLAVSDVTIALIGISPES